MAMNIERPQKSLIGAGDLPTARLSGAVPDLSGLSRIGNAVSTYGLNLIQKERADAREKADIEDTRKGLAEGAKTGQTFIGKDANGNHVETPVPQGSAAFMRGYYTGFDQVQDGKFRVALETRLNQIQSQVIAGTLEPEKAAAMMQSYVTGAVEGAPAHRRGYYAELGQGEVMQRSTLMTTQDASKKAQLVAEDLLAVTKDEIARATSEASAGADPSQSFGRIDKGYDTLVDLGRMGPEEARIAKKNARQWVSGQALVNQLNTAMARGDISPAEVDRIGTAIGVNDSTAEVVATKRYAASAMSPEIEVATGYRSKDVLFQIEDDQLRKEMSLKLRQAATDWTQRAAQGAEDREFAQALATLASPEGSNGVLDARFRDKADLLAAGILAKNNPFDTAQGRKDMLWLMGNTKYAPKTLVNNLLTMINSGDPDQAAKAVAFYREAIYLKNTRGDLVGDLIKQSIPNEAAQELDAFEKAVRLGRSVKEVQANRQKARENPGAYSNDNLITQYNALDDASFYKDVRTRWGDTFGGANIPAEALDAFTTAYRQSAIMLGDPKAAFDSAFEAVRTRFVQSPIMLTGWSATASDLTNPAGYEAETGPFGFPKANSQYQWINEQAGSSIMELARSGALVMPQLPGEEEPIGMADLEALVNQDPARASRANLSTFALGRTVKLAPVPGSNPDAPEYMAHLFDEGGTYLGPLYQKAPGGGTKPLTLNPHLLKDQVGFRHQQTQVLEKAQAGASASLERLEADYMLKLRATDPDAYYKWDDEIPVRDYLPSVSEELAKQYNLDRKMIEDGLEKARQSYEERTGQKIPRAKLSPQSLLVPRAAGFEVASSAAAVIDDVLPDGTMGAFMLRVAAHESDFGMAKGTYRMIGDKGIMQTNTRSSVVEVKRRIASGKGRVWRANEMLKDRLGIDIGAIGVEDLDKPLVSMAVARLYVEAIGQPVPPDVEGQARYWKRHYNTYLGAGTPEQFIRSARKVPDGWSKPVASGGPEATTELAWRY